MLTSEELLLKMFWVMMAIVAFICLVFLPYLEQFTSDFGILDREKNEELSFIVYLKKGSYRVLDILAIIYFLPLWLMYGIFYVFYVASIWIVENFEKLMNVTVFTKKGKRG